MATFLCYGLWQKESKRIVGLLLLSDAGHSMGGHGAWHLAVHHPDRALSVVSLAGWLKKEEYGDSNLFFRLAVTSSGASLSV